MVKSFVALLCACAASAPALAAERPARAHHEPTRAELAARVTRELLQPTLASLKEQSRRDAELSALLARVRLNTLGTPHHRLGRNAGATRDRGQLAVLVDLEFLAELAQVASLAGLGITKNEEATQLSHSAIAEYQRRVAAVRNVGPLPDFEVDPGKLKGKPALQELARRFSVEVSLTTTAWVVLHEIGHHVLNHLSIPRGPLTEERLLEEKADEWAFRKLFELGYHLHYLDWFFMAAETLEEIGIDHGLVAPETESTHPSYATRRSNLEKLFDVHEATPARMLAFLGVGWNDRGEPQPVETWIARYPDEDMQIVASVWSGSAAATSVFDWVDGEAHIYSRGGDTMTEIVIHDPGKIRTRVSIFYRNLRDGTRHTKVDAVWIQTSLAWARHRNVRGVATSLVFDNPLGTAMREALGETRVEPEARVALVREYKAFFSTLRKSLVRYASGEISIDEFAEIMDARGSEFSERAKRALGPESSETLARALMASPTVLAMMEALFKNGG